jgi:hypothetical protein
MRTDGLRDIAHNNTIFEKTRAEKFCVLPITVEQSSVERA